jgi:hypothetical protein
MSTDVYLQQNGEKYLKLMNIFLISFAQNSSPFTIRNRILSQLSILIFKWERNRVFFQYEN